MWSEEWQKDANVLLVLWLSYCAFVPIIAMDNVRKVSTEKILFIYTIYIYLKPSNDIVSQVYICWWSVELRCIFHYNVRKDEKWLWNFCLNTYNDLWFPFRHLFGFIVKFFSIITIQWLNKYFEKIEVSEWLRHVLGAVTRQNLRSLCFPKNRFGGVSANRE